MLMLPSQYQKIVILIAMADEAKPIIQALKLQQQSTDFAKPYPLQLYSGTYHDREIHVVLNGVDERFNVDNIGTQPAALSAFLALKQLQPDLLINAGTAGGFKAKGAEMGDIYLSQKICFHDRRIEIPGFKEYGIGDYPVADCVTALAQENHFKLGNVTTSNSLDMPETCQQMIAQNEGEVKEMEAASIAWVAHMFGTPMFAMKSITDWVDEATPTQEQFLENLHRACESLQKAAMKVLGEE